jgi:hypothetical protein
LETREKGAEREYKLSLIRERRAIALAEAIWRAASSDNIGALRSDFNFVALTPSAWLPALTLATHGGLEDIILICKRVAEENRQVRYWPHLTLSRVIARRMAMLGHSAPAWMTQILDRRAFWEHPRAAERPMRPEDLLPIANLENRQLFIRLIAHVIVGCAGLGESEVLCRLARHPYRFIARVAALRLVMLTGGEGIEVMQRYLPGTLSSGGDETLAAALRDAEIHFYGLLNLW